MAIELAGIGVAVIVVTASIVLAGIMIGIGRAFGYKQIEYFGIEEFLQSILNAAIIGSFAAIIELIGAVSSSVVTGKCAQGDIVAQLTCVLGSVNGALFAHLQQLVMALNLVGYYQGISLDFGAFAISPFANLASVSGMLSMQLMAINAIMMLVALNQQIAAFIGQNALGLIFPAGLVLRTFFATRKLGGFLIALALGLFVFYPTFILIFPDPVPSITNSTAVIANFTGNSYYATVPVIDLNDNGAIAAKLDLLSGRCRPSNYNLTNLTTYNVTYDANGTAIVNITNMTSVTNSTLCDDYLIRNNLTANTTVDMTGDLTLLTQASNNALSKSLLYAAIAPLFSLVITIVFVRELALLLGSEVGLRTIASI